MASIGDVSIARANQVVATIVVHIETNFKGFNISEIIKAGSLGDGTAVPGHYDIDLVVYSRDFTGMDVIRSPTMFLPWVSQLKECIEDIPEVELRCCGGEYTGYYSVEFSYNVSHEVSIDVDLLVSPHWEHPCDFYKFLMMKVPRNERIFFGVCASKWQRQFFKRQENQVVKEYIRRAKAWRNEVWGKNKEGKPKSYLLSLLVVKACEKAGRRAQAQSVTQALKALVKEKRKNVYWADKQNGFYKRSDYKSILPSRPRVIDPANPANNVWETGFFPPGHSHVLVSRIDTIDLSKPI